MLRINLNPLSLLLIDATALNFGKGTGPVYDMSCQMPETDKCNLIITQSSCAHSMDVGVRCLPFTDACPVPVSELTATTPPCNCQQPTTPTQTPTSMLAKCITSTEGDGNEMSTNRQPMSTKTSQPSDGATTESSISQSTVMITSGTLGALIGLLAAALVVVVTGWIVSCVYLQKKRNK